jgi:predicted dehydrogenase
MDREWRGQPHISGGGEMLDQGVHLIDLSRWFLGDFPEVDLPMKTIYTRIVTAFGAGLAGIL